MRNELTKSSVESVEGEHLTQDEYAYEQIGRRIDQYRAISDQHQQYMAERQRNIRQASYYNMASLNIFAGLISRYMLLGWIGKAEIRVSYRDGECYISSPIRKQVHSVWELELVKSELLNMGAEIEWDIYQWLLISIKPRN